MHLAVCDARYSFTLFDIGSSGRHSDGGVLAHSSFGHVVERGEMNFPWFCHIPGTETDAAHVILRDTASQAAGQMVVYKAANLYERWTKTGRTNRKKCSKTNRGQTPV